MVILQDELYLSMTLFNSCKNSSAYFWFSSLETSPDESFVFDELKILPILKIHEKLLKIAAIITTITVRAIITKAPIIIILYFKNLALIVSSVLTLSDELSSSSLLSVVSLKLFWLSVFVLFVKGLGNKLFFLFFKSFEIKNGINFSGYW